MEILITRVNYFLHVLNVLAPNAPWPIGLHAAAISSMNTCSVAFLARTRQLVDAEEAGAHHAVVVTPGHVRAGVARPDLAPFSLRAEPRMMKLASRAGRCADALLVSAGVTVSTDEDEAVRDATTAGLMWQMARTGLGFDDVADKEFEEMLARAHGAARWASAQSRADVLTVEDITTLFAMAAPPGWAAISHTTMATVGTDWAYVHHCYGHTRQDGSADMLEVFELPAGTPGISLSRHRADNDGGDADCGYAKPRELLAGELCDVMGRWHSTLGDWNRASAP